MFLFYTVFQRVTKIKSFYSSNDLNELICRFLKVQRQNGVLNAKRTFIIRLFKIFQAKKRFDSKRVEKFASFCKNVFEAYRKGDRIAARIIKDNVYAVANLLIAGSNFLGEKALVSFAGGVMHESKIIFPMLYDILETKKFELKAIEKEPVYGAVQIARKEFLKNAEN